MDGGSSWRHCQYDLTMCRSMYCSCDIRIETLAKDFNVLCASNDFGLVGPLLGAISCCFFGILGNVRCCIPRTLLSSLPLRALGERRTNRSSIFRDAAHVSTSEVSFSFSRGLTISWKNRRALGNYCISSLGHSQRRALWVLESLEGALSIHDPYRAICE